MAGLGAEVSTPPELCLRPEREVWGQLSQGRAAAEGPAVKATDTQDA